MSNTETKRNALPLEDKDLSAVSGGTDMFSAEPQKKVGDAVCFSYTKAASDNPDSLLITSFCHGEVVSVSVRDGKVYYMVRLTNETDRLFVGKDELEVSETDIQAYIF